MSWRPEEGWFEKKNQTMIDLKNDSYTVSLAYDAGADAMYSSAYEKGKAEGREELLEELKKRATPILGMQAGADDSVVGLKVANEPGWVVFIPKE